MPDSVPLTGETILLMENLQGTPVHSSHIKDWTKRDPILSQVLRFTLQGWPTANSNQEVNPYFSRRTELSVKDGCVLWGARAVVPPQGRPKVLAELHETQPEEARMKALARSYVWWPGIDQDIVKEVKCCDKCKSNQSALAEAPLHLLGVARFLMVKVAGSPLPDVNHVCCYNRETAINFCYTWSTGNPRE